MTEQEFMFWTAAYVAAIASDPARTDARPTCDRAKAIANAAIYDFREKERQVVPDTTQEPAP